MVGKRQVPLPSKATEERLRTTATAALIDEWLRRAITVKRPEDLIEPG